jgi:two-component system, response regulator YesN
MYHVLIAEDEPIFRKGLMSIIHWDDLGMDVVAEAVNGKEALEQFYAHHVDVLLTDLRMPILDGISLIKKIRETDKRVRIVILTCMDDFSVLQQSLDLGISSYLLKVTAEPVQIERILESVKNELDAQHGDAFKDARPEDPYGDRYIDYSLIREQIMDDFIFYRRLPVDIFADYVRRLKMRLTDRGLIVAVICLPNYDTLIKAIHDEHGRKLRSMLLDIINTRLAGYDSGEVHRDSPSSYLLLFNPGISDESQAKEALKRLLEELRVDIQKRLEVDVQYGTSSLFDGYDRLSEKRDEAMADLQNFSQSKPNQKVEIIKKYISLHYAENISLQNAADFAGITTSYASHLFSQYAGVPFTVCLNNARIEKAKQLLKSSTLMVSEVSKLAGFWDTTYFIRVFKKRTGHTPDEYRKRIFP